MRNNVAGIVGDVIDAVDGKLPIVNIIQARELLEHGEWGEALDLIYTQLYEYDVKVSQSIFDQIELAGNQMGLDSKGWEVLDIENLQVPSRTDNAGCGEQSLESPRNRESGVDVPEKYLRERANGASEMSIAESLIREGYGTVLSIRFLRQLFELSLEDANRVYEEALQRG